MTVIFHPLAERELIAAAKSYETSAPGMAADFVQQVERTLKGIAPQREQGAIITLQGYGFAPLRSQ